MSEDLELEPTRVRNFMGLTEKEVLGSQESSDVEVEVRRGRRCGGDPVNIEIEARLKNARWQDARFLAHLSFGGGQKGHVGRLNVTSGLKPKPEPTVQDQEKPRAVRIQDKPTRREMTRFVEISRERTRILRRAEKFLHPFPDSLEEGPLNGRQLFEGERNARIDDTSHSEPLCCHTFGSGDSRQEHHVDRTI